MQIFKLLHTNVITLIIEDTMNKSLDFLRYLLIFGASTSLAIYQIPYLQQVLPILLWLTIFARLLSISFYTYSKEAVKQMLKYRFETSATYMVWTSRIFTGLYLIVMLYLELYVTAVFFVITYVLLENILHKADLYSNKS
jgi:uncharacterized protein involved in cysteine biosynthesis